MQAPDFLLNSATRHAARVAVAEGERSHTFAESHDRALRLAAAFVDAGLVPGDRVALLAHNELEYLEIMVASQRAGVVLVPLNWRLALPELQYIIDDCRPALAIAGPDFAQTASGLVGPRWWHLGGTQAGERYEDRVARSTPLAMPTLDAAATATIVYTSGTTGRPKGAILSNGALAARMHYMALEYAIRPGDAFLQTLPMAHIAAYNCLPIAYVGATNVMLRTYDTRRAVEAMVRHRITHALFVPTTIVLLCDHVAAEPADLSSLRLLVYGASPIAPEVLRRAMRLLPCGFVQHYGMTETHGCTMLLPGDHDPVGHPQRLASAGTVSRSYEVRVVDPDDNDVAPGVTGEVVCRGPAVMDGYWNRPEDTAAALRNGWMHTGDMGHMDGDGFLYITDRLKDVIVSGGENIYPREVEDVLYEHAAVLEATVIGIPDERWGEAAHALVVPRGEPPAAEALLAHCRTRIAGYKVPKTLEFVDSLPHNAIGKVVKRELRERYWGGMARRVG